MKCNQAKRLVVQLCDGELKGDLSKSLELHLDSCRKCQAELEALQRTMRLMEKVTLASPDPRFWREHLAGVRRRIAVKGKRKWAPRLIPSLAAGAVAVLLAVMVLTQRGKEPDVQPSLWPSEQENASLLAYSDADPADETQLLAEKLLSPDEREALEGLYSPSKQLETEVAVIEEEIELAYEAYYNP